MLARGQQPDLAVAKKWMLEHDLRGRQITDANVLRAMAEVPREVFVPPEHRQQAYADGPLPIGHGQTISQPYIVALMTQLLRIHHACDVLEIGTGSGYQTAILSCLAKEVFTIEKYSELAASAESVLSDLAKDNIHFHVGDGSCGWPQTRMFDRIMITAAVPDFPSPVVDQLIESGWIVAPVGHGSVQELIAAEKRNGRLIETSVCGCRFVKLIGQHGFER